MIIISEFIHNYYVLKTTCALISVVNTNKIFKIQ